MIIRKNTKLNKYWNNLSGYVFVLFILIQIISFVLLLQPIGNLVSLLNKHSVVTVTNGMFIVK